MTQPAIRVENLSKRYKLGLTHAGSVRELVNRTCRRLAGKPPVEAKIGHKPASARESSRVEDDGTFWALKDVSFEVQPGEVVGIIGKNGAGKSTLLKILSRITKPTSGRAVLRGRVASLLEVGTGFHPELTGRENVYLNGAILGMTKVEVRRRFDQIVEFAGIERFIDTPVKRYSSGMYVRLAFAVAAHLEPEILIVDEVLAVGDAEFQAKCLGKMRDVARAGRTVLFVSHNMAAVRQLTSRAVVLLEGQVKFDGDTSAAIDDYIAPMSGRTEWSVTDRNRLQRDLERRVEILSIALPSGRNMIQAEEPIEFDCTMRSNGHQGGVRISLTIFTSTGTAVGSGFSTAMTSITPGRMTTVRLTIPDHRLAPAIYTAAISVGTGDNRTAFVDFDTVDQVLSFEILPLSAKNGVLSVWNRGWGHVRFSGIRLNAIVGDSEITTSDTTSPEAKVSRGGLG